MRDDLTPTDADMPAASMAADAAKSSMPTRSSDKTSLDEASPDKPPSQSLFWSVFPSVMLPMFLAVADQTIVATALPAIASDVGEVERISWVVVSYLIANTIAAPVYGRLGDSFGRRAYDSCGARLVHGRIGAVRAGSQHRIPRPPPASCKASAAAD